MRVAEPLVQTGLLGEAIDPGPALIFIADEDVQYVAVNQLAARRPRLQRVELLGLRVTRRRRRPRREAHFDDLKAREMTAKRSGKNG